MRKTKKINKEEVAEDYCFHCKDGGLLRICDYKECLKSYHPSCVGKDDSFLESEARWYCSWHFCFICQKASKFYCYCCPKGICGRCIEAAEFAHVSGDKGFCNHCLKLALLVEEKKDIDSDGDKIDFEDRNTVEFLFRDYWEIIRDREGLNVANLRSANTLLKNNQNFQSWSELDEIDSDTDYDQLMISDYDDMDDIGGQKPNSRRKRASAKKPKGQKRPAKRRVRQEYIGWGSRPLINFLASIGKDTSTKLSQHDVTSIINNYIRDNKLFHPEKKKRVVCDERLLSVLGRKVVKKNKIYDLLEVHLADNCELTEDDEFGCSSDDRNELSATSKRQRKSELDQISSIDTVALGCPKSCYASVVAENIKLVYLKRSLVVELLKQPESFDGKVIGSFVRIKSDPNDFLQKNSHLLVQVTGVNKSFETSQANTEVFLQVSNVQMDIPIRLLSDCDFLEEECEDLRQRIRGGLLRRPMVVEFEKKAQNLHKDITKHAIVRELAFLNNLIDQANEKGWRKEFFEYMERRKLLETPSEKLRLLQEVPKVIADLMEPEPAAEGALIYHEQWLNESSNTIVLKFKTTNNDTKDLVELEPVAEETLRNHEKELNETSNSATANMCKPKSSNSQVQHDKLQNRARLSFLEESRPSGTKGKHQFIDLERDFPHLYTSASKKQTTIAACNGLHQSNYVAKVKQNHATDQEILMEKPQKALAIQLIELSDDDEEDAKVETEELRKDDCDANSSMWYCIGPNGDRKGPFTSSLLERWVNCSSYASCYKVWKMGECQEKAIAISEAIEQIFARNSTES